MWWWWRLNTFLSVLRKCITNGKSVHIASTAHKSAIKCEFRVEIDHKNKEAALDPFARSFFLFPRPLSIYWATNRMAWHETWRVNEKTIGHKIIKSFQVWRKRLNTLLGHVNEEPALSKKFLRFVVSSCWNAWEICSRSFSGYLQLCTAHSAHTSMPRDSTHSAKVIAVEREQNENTCATISGACVVVDDIRIVFIGNARNTSDNI